MTIPDKAIEAAGAELQTHIELSESLAKAMARDAITIALPYLQDVEMKKEAVKGLEATVILKSAGTFADGYCAGIESELGIIRQLVAHHHQDICDCIGCGHLRALADEKQT